MPAGGEIANRVYISARDSIRVEGVSGGTAIPVTGSTPSTVGDGLKLVTTAGTRETLIGTPTAAKSVVITAKLTNTGVVVVGGATVVAASGATRRGTPLNAGDSVAIDVDDLQKLYVDVTVSGEGVTYTYTN